MKILTKMICCLFLGAAVAASAASVNHFTEYDGVRYKKNGGSAQYGGSDYKNAIRVERNISLDRAFEIANSDPEIGYFFHMTGWQMVLNCDDSFDPVKDDPLGLVAHTHYRSDNGNYGRGNCRIFRQGDAVFFKKEGMWLGSAVGYSDTYIKE